MKRLAITLTALLATTANADTTSWQDIQTQNTNNKEANTTSARLQQFRLLSLDETNLKNQIDLTSSNNTALANSAQARAESITLSLPLPDGSFAEVIATPSNLLAADVAAEHPEIQTWKVQGTDGKVISGVMDFTTLGFHAMLEMANGDTLFIDPQEVAGERQYISFSKQANREAFRSDWTCGNHDAINSFRPDLSSNTAVRTAAAKAGETLQNYDIAIAATAEYTAYFGSQANALSAIVSTLNRVNQIYERDLAIHLNLVSGTNIIYTDAASDPYTNGNAVSMIEENQKSLATVLGENGYDVGHVFGKTDGGNGLAIIEATCTNGYKAQGTTSFSSPKGDAFDIDYVAHELGHQFGATHTFNSQTSSCGNGNRQAETAYEAGSGSTIMAYTGICGSDNLQSNSDAMFHAASISQIIDYAHNGSGASCASSSSLSNTNPTANAGSDYTIPAGVPFLLSGSGSDSNGDTLSYSWEQIDAGTASNVNSDTGDNALIRTHLPSSSPARFVPQLSDLTSGAQSAGEYLPITNRTLNFRLQVRDGKGGTSYDDMKVTTYNTGSTFAVTNPTSKTLYPSAIQTVSWNVAGTDQSPISCSNVDIAITTDNGSTFSTLLSNTPNDGSAAITLPSSLGSSNFIRVKCSNNLFFAMSATNPAKATASSGSSDNSTSITSSGSGGSGTLPLEWLVLGGAAALFKRRRPLRKGVAR